MEWHLSPNRGFLPLNDPLPRLTDANLKHIERLGADLPQLVHDRKFRDASVAALAPPLDWDALLQAKSDAEIERLFLLYSYIASAYVHSPGMPAANRLPAPIAVPLVRLGQHLDRPPILSYASYCLHNWQRVDLDQAIALGNIQLTQNFSLPGDGKSDEDWFILVHVDIEARAALVLSSIRTAQACIDKNEVALTETALDGLRAGLHAMNQTMNRMPEGCSADVYFRKVRPYIFGFNDIIYESCFGDAPQTYRGETGAQSSIVPTVLRALGIQHQNSMLTKHLDDMQTYMPTPHRQFIRETKSVRDFVVKHGGNLTDLYNASLTELIAFRSRHFEYAVNYIEKKVDNPIATGGTPYVPWLRQLIEETKTFYVS
jgi:indoleamine 2,3-dioxygenase